MSICIWCLDDGYGDNKLFNGKHELLIPSHATSWRQKMKSEIKEVSSDPFATARGGWKYGIRHAIKKQGNILISYPGGGVQKVMS